MTNSRNPRGEEASSRAEQLRRKRQQESQSRYTNVKQKISQAPASQTAPVSSRTFPYNPQGYRSATNMTPRRKVVYAQGANGTEIRLPAIPIVHFDWKMVSGTLAVILLITVLMLTTLSAFDISSVKVEGITRVPAGDIVTVLRTNASSIFTLNRAEAVKAIAASFPELTNIHIRTAFPSSVVVTAIERQPILAWTSGDQTLWIDKDGVVMPVRGEVGALVAIQSSVTPPLTNPLDTTQGVLDYAILALANQSASTTGEMVIPQMDPNVLKAAIELTAQLPEGASLVYDPVEGMGWVDPRGWKVFFGINLSDLTTKEAEYQAIVDKLTQQGITPVTISVEFPHAPYYRTE